MTIRRIIVLDANRKVWNLVARAIKSLLGCRVEGFSFLEDAQTTLTDALHFDIRLFVIGDVPELERPEVRKWAHELYMAGHKVVWLSKTPPPLAEITHVIKTEPFTQALESEILVTLQRVLRS